MREPNFSTIAPRCGSQDDAFEELCCQLARRWLPSNGSFERFRGAGGDGGIECKATLPDGRVIGWQAKFLGKDQIDDLIGKADQSLTTALAIHPDLTEFVLCFPFTPTSRTGRKKKSGAPAVTQSDKLAGWKQRRIGEQRAKMHQLAITLWSAHDLLSLMLEHDASGGLREFFFNETILTAAWFGNHLASAAKTAGPRYSPRLSLDTPLLSWFEAFEGGENWSCQAREQLRSIREAVRRFEASVRCTGGSLGPPWPVNLASEGNLALSSCEAVVHDMETSLRSPAADNLDCLRGRLPTAVSQVRVLRDPLAIQIDSEHGEGSSESKQFRSHMAEYFVSIPTECLDATEKMLQTLLDAESWLTSPVGVLGFHQVFVLTGDGGSGKTHGICDTALRRLKDGACSCVLFGHQFSGDPVDWERFSREMGLPPSLGRDAVWDALEAAGEASGKPLIIWLDAINETKPRTYWRDRLHGFAAELCKRPNLKLCVSCRSSFERACLPVVRSFPIIEHKGFRGMERRACGEFFAYYGLTPPVTPLLQPELANPLYLKLVCETLRARGLKHLPAGWSGLAPAIQAFLDAKEEQFALENDCSSGAETVSRSLSALVTSISTSSDLRLSWSDAETVLVKRVPSHSPASLIGWLIRADLLIEDGRVRENGETESVLRPAFERMGDFLTASEMMPKECHDGLTVAFAQSKALQALLGNAQSIRQNPGLVAALTIIVSERYPFELTEFVDDVAAKAEVRVLVLDALSWRTPQSFTNLTRRLVNDQFNIDGFVAMERVLAVSTLASVIDAWWIHSMHSGRTNR